MSDQPPAPTNTPPANDPPPAAPPVPPEPPAPGAPPAPAGQTFTQADVDRIVGDRLAAERRKHDQALADAQAVAGKSETERLTIERDQAAQRAADTVKAAALRIATTEAKVAALAANANPQRIAAIIRNADLAAAIAEDGQVDEAAVAQAVDAVLAEYPEWRTNTTPARSGGNLNGGPTGKRTWTRAEIQAMTQAERIKHADELAEALGEGRITG